MSAEMFHSFPTGQKYAGHWKIWLLPPEPLNRSNKSTHCSTMFFMLPQRNVTLKGCKKYYSKTATKSALRAAIPSASFPLLRAQLSNASCKANCGQCVPSLGCRTKRNLPLTVTHSAFQTITSRRQGLFLCAVLAESSKLQRCFQAAQF